MCIRDRVSDKGVPFTIGHRAVFLPRVEDCPGLEGLHHRDIATLVLDKEAIVRIAKGYQRIEALIPAILVPIDT
eukprot:3362071-Amphidinium_carterae.1